MLCPIDQTELVMTERQGVEIDYCPKCRGVWLDRGELDKIIDRVGEGSGVSAAGSAAGGAAKGSFTTPRVGDMQGRVQPLESERRYDDDDDYDDRRYREGDASDWDQRKHKKTKRRSFFEELFDFD
jgi:Zn-finger nucleic acid-binding protein